MNPKEGERSEMHQNQAASFLVNATDAPCRLGARS